MFAAHTRVPILLLPVLAVTFLRPVKDRTEGLVGCAEANACAEGCEEQGCREAFLSGCPALLPHEDRPGGYARRSLAVLELPAGAAQEVVKPPPERAC